MSVANEDTQAAWRSHDGTQHPGGFLMDPWHSYDPGNNPLLFKKYVGLEPIPLPLDKSSLGPPALTALSTNAGLDGTERLPDLPTLARILYFSAGITKRIKYPPPWGETPFRAAACTGALYHIELYVVCKDLPDLPTGVYHFDPEEMALRRLRSGDYRQVLSEAAGEGPAVASAPVVIVYTDVFWRNAVKDQAREYRHAFWDCGTILANTLAMASAHSLPAKVVVGFVDEAVNRLLDLEARREAALALVPLGEKHAGQNVTAPAVTPLGLTHRPYSSYERQFPAIWEMHAASSLQDAQEVAEWRREKLAAGRQHTQSPGPLPPPGNHLIPLRPVDDSELPMDSLESVIVRRGSTRQFAREAITFGQLSTILGRAIRGIPADWSGSEPASSAGRLNEACLIVNAVEGLPPGAYAYDGQKASLLALKQGDFRATAGALGLHQELPADASVDVFFLADLKVVLERFGNRGYRAAQLEASITAGRLYLAAYALGLGASGLTFFDDAVTDFFSPHARGKSVIFLMALGRPAKGRRT